MKLDVDKARHIFEEKIARPINLSVEQAAFGIFRIANAQISDLIHKITVEQGLDPRDFVLHAFGGSCPMIASSFARELNVKRIIVPYAASVNCAFGLATADIVHEYAHIETLSVPTTAEIINNLYEPMLEQATSALSQAGFTSNRMQFKWSVGFRYALQVHEIITPIRGETPLNEQSMNKLVVDFEQLYESKYGKGSAYRDAGIEMTQFRLTASGLIDRPDLLPRPIKDSDAGPARIGRRKIYVDNHPDLIESDVYDFELLEVGNELDGPAVIHTPITTIVIQDGQNARMDEYQNIIIEEAKS